MTLRSPLRNGAPEKSLDKLYTYVITCAMLARQITLPKPLFDFYPLCFDHLKNPFLRKSRVFTSIQNHQGVTPNSSLPKVQVLCLLLHTCNPCSFMRLRTLLRNGGAPNHSISMRYALFSSPRGWYPLVGQEPASESGRYKGEKFDGLEAVARGAPV